MTGRLRCWNERVHGVCDSHPWHASRAEHDRPSIPLLTVAMPANGLQTTPEALVGLILAQTAHNDVDLIAEPSPALVAAWKRGECEDDVPPAVCQGWRSWGPLCLVCHRHVPDGEATVYPFIFGSRACIDYCADMVNDLLRIYDRSKRGRWRPIRDVHTRANGALCNACMAVAKGSTR